MSFRLQTAGEEKMAKTAISWTEVTAQARELLVQSGKFLPEMDTNKGMWTDEAVVMHALNFAFQLLNEHNFRLNK